MAGNIIALPAAIQALVQVGFLEQNFFDGLDSVLAYRDLAMQETIPTRTGETYTKTRYGRKTPIDTFVSASSVNSNLDNGLTPGSFSIEQYLFAPGILAATQDVNIMQEDAAIQRQSLALAKNHGIMAAQSLERVARRKLFTAYMAGNSRVRTDLGAAGTTSCYIDDGTGFTTNYVNGVVTAVNGGNPLTVSEQGTTPQTLSVTGFTPDSPTRSAAPYGVSGLLIFASATTPTNGDTLIAAGAPKMMRPNGKLNTAALTGSDMLTMSSIEDAVAWLRDNAIPEHTDGTYHCVLDNTSMRQLFADPDFKQLYTRAYDSREFKEGKIFELLGVKYYPTTEAPLTNIGAAPDITVKIRRVIITGTDVLTQGNYGGMLTWASRADSMAISEINMSQYGVAQIIRPALDRLGEVVAFSWKWEGDFAVPTDNTASTQTIPTSTNAIVKRALIIEHAG